MQELSFKEAPDGSYIFVKIFLLFTNPLIIYFDELQFLNESFEVIDRPTVSPLLGFKLPLKITLELNFYLLVFPFEETFIVS